MSAVVPMFRARDEVEADLRAGLHSLAHLGDELDRRAVTNSDVSAIDGTVRGINRLLSELRVALTPSRETA